MYVLKLFNGKLPLDEKCKRLLKTLFIENYCSYCYNLLHIGICICICRLYSQVYYIICIYVCILYIIGI